MPEELVPGDVEQYTNGRLAQDDPETVRALAAALARVRRWCGWHVSPVITETVYIDRPDGSMLVLPTLKIVSLGSVTVNGTAVDLSNVKYSREAPGVIQRNDLRPWADNFSLSPLGAIAVAVTHGFTAIEAADFREAVLQLLDLSTLAAGSGGDGPLTEKKVDDVTYQWAGARGAGIDRLPGALAKNPMNESILYQYRLLPFA